MLWKLDPAHSSIEFAVKHMMIATVRGRFSKFDVTADIDPNDLSKTKAEVTVDVASIDTREEQRDNHLRSGDFFAITEHPTMTFITNRWASPYPKPAIAASCTV